MSLFLSLSYTRTHTHAGTKQPSVHRGTTRAPWKHSEPQGKQPSISMTCLWTEGTLLIFKSARVKNNTGPCRDSNQCSCEHLAPIHTDHPTIPIAWRLSRKQGSQPQSEAICCHICCTYQCDLVNWCDIGIKYNTIRSKIHQKWIHMHAHTITSESRTKLNCRLLFSVSLLAAHSYLHSMYGDVWFSLCTAHKVWGSISIAQLSISGSKTESSNPYFWKLY